MKEFSTLRCMGRYKSLGLLKPFLSYASQLSGASILHLFRYPPHPQILSASTGSGGSPMAAREQALFFLGTLRAQKSTFRGPESLIAVPSFFTDTAGNASFLETWSHGLLR